MRGRDLGVEARGEAIRGRGSERFIYYKDEFK